MHSVRAKGVKLSEHFTDTEFACKCCGMVVVNPELVEKLELLRKRVNRPVFVNSGFRCALHNKAVGGAPKSQHLVGNAADIVVPQLSPQAVARHAEAVGFSGIGIYRTFTHTDVRGYRARWTM